MVTFLVARVPAGPSGVGAELLSGPAPALLRRQLDVLRAGAEAVVAVARTGAAQLDPGVAGAVAGLAAAVVAAFVMAFVVALAVGLARLVVAAPRPRPEIASVGPNMSA